MRIHEFVPQRRAVRPGDKSSVHRTSRRSTRGRELFRRYRLVIQTGGRICGLLPLRLRNALFQSFRNMNGLPGMGIRYILLWSLCKSLGNNVLISPGVFLLHPENLSIGNNVSIHPMCYIEATGGISLANDISIAHSTTILSTEHQFANTYTPIKDQQVVLDSVRVNDNVWIGARAVILAGVEIAPGCVIGAGSVVTRSTVPGGVYVGSHAGLMKVRQSS